MNAPLDACYQDLPPQEARAYRLLALHPGPDFDVAAAGALLAASATEAAVVLDRLMGVSLLHHTGTITGQDRYGYHHLTGVHAHQMAEVHEDPAQRRAALARVLDHYVRAAAAADHQHLPSRQRVGRAYFLARLEPPAHHDADAAMGWLDTHITTLVAAQRAAATLGRHDLAWQLGETMWGWCQSRRDHAIWEPICQIAIISARSCGDPVAQARMTGLLSQARRDAGDLDGARELAETMLTLARAAGDPMSEVTAYEQFAAIHLSQATRTRRSPSCTPAWRSWVGSAAGCGRPR